MRINFGKTALFVVMILLAVFMVHPLFSNQESQQKVVLEGSVFIISIDNMGKYHIENKDGQLSEGVRTPIYFPLDTKKVLIQIDKPNSLFYEYEFNNKKSETLDYQAIKKFRELVGTIISEKTATGKGIESDRELLRTGMRNEENDFVRLAEYVKTIDELNSEASLLEIKEDIIAWEIVGKNGIEENIKKVFKEIDVLLEKASKEEYSTWSNEKQGEILWSTIIKMNQRNILDSIENVKKFQKNVIEMEKPKSYEIDIDKNEMAECEISINKVGKYIASDKNIENKYLWILKPKTNWSTSYEIGAIMIFKKDSDNDETLFPAGIITHLYNFGGPFSLGIQAGIPTGISGVFLGGCIQMSIIKIGGGKILFKDTEEMKTGWYFEISANISKILGISEKK